MIHKTCRSRLLFALCLLPWLFDVAQLPAANWAGFRGDEGNGLAEAEKPPTFFGQSSNTLWKTEVVGGLSSPIIWGNQIFLTGSTDNKLSTVCLDAKSGKTLWEKSVTPEKMEPVHKVNSHATSTPVTDGHGVYVYFGSLGLLAYDLTGKELWRKALPIPKTFFNQGTGTSPILAGGKLLLFVQIGSESHLLAVDPADGHELWKGPLPMYNNSYATPVHWKENGQDMAGMSCAGRFTAFQVADGKEAWWVDGLGYQACSTPVADGEKLYIAAAGVQGELSNMTPPPTFEEAVKKFDRDGDGLVAFEEIPEDFLFTDRQTSDGKGNMPLRQAFAMFGGVKKTDKLNAERWQEVSGGITGFRSGFMNRTVVLAVRGGGKKNATESVIWKESRGVPEVPSPLLWQNRLYLIRSGGLLVCRDAATGKLIYENRIESPGGYFASPVLANGKLIVASDRGTMTVVKAGDDFEVLAHNELGEPILASPALAGNTMYVRSLTRLWAFKDRQL
jgi:outer membrane protein assembly factor BamB